MNKKKLLVMALILALCFCGCATVKGWFCSPTADMISKATTWAAQLAALQPFYPPGTVIGNAILTSKPNVDKIRDGYCVSDQDNFITYVQGLIDGADQVAQLKMLKDPDGQTFKGLKALGLKKE